MWRLTLARHALSPQFTEALYALEINTERIKPGQKAPKRQWTIKFQVPAPAVVEAEAEAPLVADSSEELTEVRADMQHAVCMQCTYMQYICRGAHMRCYSVCNVRACASRPRIHLSACTLHMHLRRRAEVHTRQCMYEVHTCSRWSQEDLRKAEEIMRQRKDKAEEDAAKAKAAVEAAEKEAAEKAEKEKGATAAVDAERKAREHVEAPQ